MPKPRNRARSGREELRYRILLHTGTEKVIGQAQWRQHLKLGNLTRKTEDLNVFRRLAQDDRLALVTKGLRAFEHEATGQVCFESIVSSPPILGPKSNYWALVQAFLYMEPTLPLRVADELITRSAPLVRMGSPFDQSGGLVLYR